MSFEAIDAVDGKSVLFVNDGSTNKFGGVEDAVNSMATIARRNGMNPEVMVAEGRSPQEISKHLLTNIYPEEIRVTRTRYGNEGSTLIEKVAHRLTGASNYIAPAATGVQRAAIRRTKPNLAHFMWPNQPQHGGRIAKFFGEVSPDTALVGTYHITSDDTVLNGLTAATAFWERKELRRFDAQIAVSPVAAKHGLHTGFLKGEPTIIPNPIDVKFFEEAKPFEEEEIIENGVRKADKYMVFVGRLDDRKGVGRVIEAFAKLNDVMVVQADVQLVICGDGLKEEREKYEQLAEDLGVQNVSFLGKVSHKDKARWLSTADLAVFAAEYGETQGIVLAEAMAAGALVIASDIDGYRFSFDSLSKYDQEEILFRANFKACETSEQYQRMLCGMVERMYRYLTEETLAENMRKKQAKVVQRFDLSVIEKEIIDVYGKVLSGRVAA